MNFPIPTPWLCEHSQKVYQHLVEKMITQGPLCFKDYMQEVLYAPGLGYYSAGNQKFGEKGDFVTAPEISPLFSWCVARQCQQVLTHLNGGDIVEFGAGSGKMARDILLYLKQQNALPNHYYIIELSAELKNRQHQLLQQALPDYFANIVWLSALPAEKIEGIVLANEVIDAMPVHKFKIDNNDVQEFFVDVEDDTLVWCLGKPIHKELSECIKNYQLRLSQGYESEINLLVSGWIKSITEFLTSGLILLIDYGFPRHEYYHSDRSMGTLMCHFQHQSHSDPLIYPGIQDITAHVDFTLVAEAALQNNFQVSGFVNQASFLMNCDITGFLHNVSDDVQRFNLNQQVKRLMLPSEMGELFKAMALTKNIDLPLLGFQMFDQRHKLG